MKWPFFRSRDAELREELEYHLDRRAELDQSTQADAKRQFGNPTYIQEEMRAMRIPIWLDGLRQDLAYAIRTFTRTPGFTAASIIALALGIGSVTAVFSVVDPLLFRPLPYNDANRLVSIGMAAPIEPSEWLLGPDYIEWREKQTAFEAMTSMAGASPCDLTENDPVRLTCGKVESTFLPMFGIRPLMGRNFYAEEDQPNASPVGLISHTLWQGRFGGALNIIGRFAELDGKRTEVVGVLPKDFEFPNLRQVDWIVPNRLDVKQQLGRETMQFLRVFGRLKPGVNVDQARESLRPLFDHAMTFVPPQFVKEVKLRVSGFREHQVGDFKTASLTLLGAVFGVLLVASANVANLMLARGASREREMAVRAAIGASRRRLLRQALTENIFLSGIAAIGGVGLGYLLLAMFKNAAPEGVPRLSTASIDLRVLSFAILLSLLTGIIAGLAPALRIPATESFAGNRTAGSRRDWLRQGLTAAQLAISLVLLIGSMLLMESLWKIQRIELGVQTGQVIKARIDLNADRYKTPEAKHAFYDGLENALRQIPGTGTVSLSDSVPPLNRYATTNFAMIRKEGVPADKRSGTGGMVSVRRVTPQYFDTLRIPIVQGRPFSEQDRNGVDALVIVDETLARRLFPGEAALGKRIRGGYLPNWATIVGVARNARNGGLFDASDPEFYILQRNLPDFQPRSTSVLLRTQRDPRLVMPLLPETVHRLDAKLPVDIQTLDAEVHQLSARPRFNTLLLGLFAFFALMLAAIGLAGVVSYLVTKRTQELGVRMALGASPGEIRKLVLSQTLRWIIAGAAAGLAVGLIAARSIESLLYGVNPNDPVIVGGVTILLIAIGILAAWLPAQRASKLDPMVALRHD